MLYKYRNWDNRAKDMLTKGEFYFATPESLNDPLDCAFYTEHVLNGIRENASEDFMGKLDSIASRLLDDPISGPAESVFEALKTRLTNVGILSLSKTPNETLMWSHYADGHKGVSIGIHKQYFDNISHETYAELDIIGPYNVKYKESPDFHEVISKYVAREIKTNQDINILHLLVDILIPVVTTKSLSWKYESEYRVIRHSKGALNIPLEYIGEIIVGSKVSETVVSEIKNLIDTPSLQHVAIKKAEFSGNTFSMAMVDA